MKGKGQIKTPPVNSSRDVRLPSAKIQDKPTAAMTDLHKSLPRSVFPLLVCVAVTAGCAGIQEQGGPAPMELSATSENLTLTRALGVSVTSENQEQTIYPNAPTAVEFTKALWPVPPSGWFDSGEPNKIVIMQEGIYQVNWGVVCQAGSGAGVRNACLVLVPGGTPRENPPCRDQRPANGTETVFLGGSVVLELVQGDEVMIQFSHSDSGSLKIGSSNPNQTNRLDAIRISSLQ